MGEDAGLGRHEETAVMAAREKVTIMLEEVAKIEQEVAEF